MVFNKKNFVFFLRNPKAPNRDHFLNMDPSNWEQYDIDWPPFSSTNPSYLNIGIPPVVSKNYRQQYMNFWNNNLNEQLNMDPKASTDRSTFDNATSFIKPMIPHVNYYLDRSTENPIRKLQYLLHQTGPNRSDMYQTQSTVEIPKIYDAVSASPENTFVLGDNQIIVKADSTLNVLIAMVIIFLVINVIIITIYLVRRNYFKKNLKRKLDVLSLDGTTDDDLKRSNKFNDGDESFILDIVRRKNEYVPVKRYHSPINGFLLTRHYSTSTMDTHTKVSDWITQEVNRQSPHLRSKSPSFSFGTSNMFYKKADEHNGTRQPIELMKSKSFELNTRTGMIYQPMDTDFLPQKSDCILEIDHRHTNSDPSEMTYTPGQAVDEQITSFIEDINVTSRDECDGATTHFTLTPEETLQIYQMRNYPKVLPNHPNSEYVSASSFKRRSMPSYQHLLNKLSPMPPVPPPRTTSTLDRKLRRSDGSAPLTPVMVQPEPMPSSIDEEPEIAYNALYVGPLLPGSKENLYSTVNRKKQLKIESQPCIIEAQIENGDETKKFDSEIMQPKSIMKRPTKELYTNETTKQQIPQSDQVLSTSSKIPILNRISTSANSNTSSSSDSNKTNSNHSKIINDDDDDDTTIALKQSVASLASAETSSSAETIRQIF